jgi:transitional endoplasmic reticulum ATPase
LEPLSKIPVDEVVKDELKEIRQLAPGDFRLIRDRYSFYKQSEITHQILVESLRKESNIKQFQNCDGKRIGF